MRDYYQMSAEDVRQGKSTERRNRSQWIDSGTSGKVWIRTNCREKKTTLPDFSWSSIKISPCDLLIIAAIVSGFSETWRNPSLLF